MKMTILPAASGWQWLVQGFALLRRYPRQILLVNFLWAAGVFALILIPFVGVLLAGLQGPASIAGIITLYRNLEQGRDVSLDAFLQPLRERLTPLIGFAGIYLIAYLCALAVSVLVFILAGGEDFSSLPDLLNASDNADISAIARLLPAMYLALLVFFVLLCPIFMAYWFTPLLIAWRRVPVGKAIFFSFVACLRNWRAFLVNGLALLAFGMGIGFVMGLLVGFLAVLISPGFASAFAFFLSLVLAIFTLSIMLAVCYISYREVFTETSGAELPSEAGLKTP